MRWLQFCDQIGVSPDAVTAPMLESVDWAMQAVAEVLDEDYEDEAGESEMIAASELEASTKARGST